MLRRTVATEQDKPLLDALAQLYAYDWSAMTDLITL